MHILISGDSWGKGEWNVECTEILHTGLEQYIINSGHTVSNVSMSGASNLDTVNIIKGYLERDFYYDRPDLILVFQTEYTRDFKYLIKPENTGDWKDLNSIKDLSSRWIERFYMRLSEISIENNIPIYIIGGCSDTIPFDDMSKDYPDCHIACQSMTNLLINGTPDIKFPVYSWYTKRSQDLIEYLRKNFSSHLIEDLLEQINRGADRENEIRQNLDLFWPDGFHPNRKGHEILFRHLEKKGIFEK